MADKDKKTFREGLDKKVSGMRSQTMTFANEGMEVALSIPDTADVKEVFGTVIDTVSEQHEELDKLGTNLDDVAVENRKARKKLQDATSDKLQQLLTFQLKLDEQLQAAQRNIRNFAYNIQGYVDDKDEVIPSISSGSKVIKDIVLTVEDEAAAERAALFPTEEGAAPQSNVSFQAQEAEVPKKRPKRHDLSGIDYHTIPPFTLPTEVKARWRWVIKKTLQSIRRKKLKIGFTRTRIEKSQTLVARLDNLDQELCKVPGMVTGKIQEAVEKVMTDVGAELQSIKTDLSTHMENAAKEKEENNVKFEELFTIVKGMEEKSNGKIQELEEKVDLQHKETNDKMADLGKQIKDMFELSLDQLKNSLKIINENLTNLDQQAAKLLVDIQKAAVTINDAPEDKSERLKGFMHDNSILQEYQSQIGVVEGATDMIQRTVKGLSTEISGALHHYGQKFNHVVDDRDMQELKDLLNKSKGADSHIKGLRDTLYSMKKIMNLHHKMLKEATEDILQHSLQYLNAVPKLETNLVQLKERHDQLYTSFESSETEKKEIQDSLEFLQQKMDDVEAKQAEQSTLLEEAKNAPPATTSHVRPTHSAGQHRRPSSARPPSRPLSSSRKESYDDSPRETEYNESKSATPLHTHRHSAAPRRESGTTAKEIAGIKLQIEGLKDAIFNKMMKSQFPKSSKVKSAKPSSAKKANAVEPPKVLSLADPASEFNDSAPVTATEGEIQAEPASARPEQEQEQEEKVLDEDEIAEDDGEDEEDEGGNFSLESMLKTLFPDEKLERKIDEILEMKLPGIISSIPIPIPTQQVATNNQAPNSSNTNQPRANPVAGINQPSQQGNYTSNIKESIRKAVEQADSAAAGQPIQARDSPTSPHRNNSTMSADNNNRKLIGSFVDYNAQNFVRAGGPETLPANFDSTPYISDIASLRSENLILNRKVDQMLDNFIDGNIVRQICQDLFREQRRKESKTDYKAMVEDMDQTVRELVNELLSVKKSNESNLAKLRDQFEQALGQALQNVGHEDPDNADALTSTKGLCLGCGRTSYVRNSAASRPTSPSFLPALNAHVQPGPDIYRSGFRLPVRTSSPPPGHHTEIPLLMRSRVMTAPEAKHGLKPLGQESLLTPSVTTLKIPSLSHAGASMVSEAEPNSSRAEKLQVGFEEDEDHLAMPAIPLQQITPVNYGFEQEHQTGKKLQDRGIEFLVD